MKLIECVPNISEGRNLQIIDAIANAVAKTAGVKLIHQTSDYDHHRSVLTFVGEAPAIKTAVLNMYQTVASLIDMQLHQGEHPRIGAVDVCPFIPLGEAKMAECVRLAEEVGQLVAERFNLPVFLYEEAASQPERKRLENIRRGEYEGLAAKMTEKKWLPDFGPKEMNPRLGATVIGARKILIAYNVYLHSADLTIAKRIASAVRESGGGLKNVKALGIKMATRGQVQVSLNLTDYETTPIYRALELVKAEAARYGVAVASTELIGLAPAQAFLAASAYYLQLENLDRQQILEFLISEEEN